MNVGGNHSLYLVQALGTAENLWAELRIEWCRSMVHKVGVSASTGILLAMQILRPLARLAEPETLEVEPSDLGLNKASS